MLAHSILFVLLLVGTVRCFPQSRVVNGTDSDIRKFPFLVSLRGPGGSHSCGASIIAPNWILTAAHCTERYRSNPSELSIQYGATEVNRAGPNIATVKRIIVHEKFDFSTSAGNDIALLELHAELEYNYDTIAPVTLPTQNFEIPQVPQGAPGTLIGWGSSITGGPLKTRLQEVDLKIYSDKECNSRHLGVTNNDHICGGVDEGGKGQCSGDSGGPLLDEDSVQLGVVSWSIKPCMIYPYPGVFTKVSHYVDWIHRQMAAASLN